MNYFQLHGNEDENNEFSRMPSRLQRRIKTALKAPIDELVVTSPAANIYQPDLMRLLEHNGKVNDEIINFYFNMIVDKSKRDSRLPKVYAMKTFFYM